LPESTVETDQSNIHFKVAAYWTPLSNRSVHSELYDASLTLSDSTEVLLKGPDTDREISREEEEENIVILQLGKLSL
jgi:hypothetical protein